MTSTSLLSACLLVLGGLVTGAPTPNTYSTRGLSRASYEPTTTTLHVPKTPYTPSTLLFSTPSTSSSSTNREMSISLLPNTCLSPSGSTPPLQIKTIVPSYCTNHQTPFLLVYSKAGCKTQDLDVFMTVPETVLERVVGGEGRGWSVGIRCAYEREEALGEGDGEGWAVLGFEDEVEGKEDMVKNPENNLQPSKSLKPTHDLLNQDNKPQAIHFTQQPARTNPIPKQTQPAYISHPKHHCENLSYFSTRDMLFVGSIAFVVVLLSIAKFVGLGKEEEEIVYYEGDMLKGRVSSLEEEKKEKKIVLEG